MARSSGLKPRDFHVSVHKKFWPKLKYGLCANPTPFNELVHAMHKPYYWMAPVGGLIRSAKRELRYLSTGFYGLGFPHWGIEALIESYSKFFSHYGTDTIVGVQLRMSTELLIIELGISVQPFLQDFDRYGHWATDGICKALWEKLHRFKLRMTLGECQLHLPREHDNWLMHSFESLGFDTTEREALNKVRLHQQVIFESDIFHADGISLNTRYLQPRRLGERWSKLQFGRQKPPLSAIALWREALGQLAPGGRRSRSLGRFKHDTHIDWTWKYDIHNNMIYQLTSTGTYAYEASGQAHRTRQRTFHLVGHTGNPTPAGALCSVLPRDQNTVTIHSHCPAPPSFTITPKHFVEVLRKWNHLWMWDNLKFTGDGTWIYTAIKNHTLLCVSDGSYISQLHTDVCATAVMMECTDGGGTLSLSFAENSPVANAYRGELLGLMAIHLLLYSCKISQDDLTGAVKIYSDCTGALRTMKNLPTSRVPPSWKHADILKVISVYGTKLSLDRTFHHVKAHQDDDIHWGSLTRESQLNCMCDAAAKRQIFEYQYPTQANCEFPLEPVTLSVEGNKLTSDTGYLLRYHLHKYEAEILFQQQGLLTPAQFEEIDWKHVYDTLNALPKMFQMFAMKQMFNVSAVLSNLSKQKQYAHLGDKCPSCTCARETAGHILSCNEEGRVMSLRRQIQRVLVWLSDIGANPELTQVLANFLLTRGSMLHLGRALHTPPEYHDLIASLETIGWRHTMEGKISKELTRLPREDLMDRSCVLSPSQLVQELIKRLIEASHGQWIYRNLIMHDHVSGHVITRDKEEIVSEIERQKDLGGEGLDLQDQWMAEVHLPDLDTSTGERETYWLLAIKAARQRHYSSVTNDN
jgi:hypothetical protein